MITTSITKETSTSSLMENGNTRMDRSRIQAWFHWGSRHRAQGRYENAAALFKQAFALARQTCGAQSLEAAQALNHLALLAQDQGDFRAAEYAYRRALTMIVALFGSEHRRAAIIYYTSCLKPSNVSGARWRSEKRLSEPARWK